VKTEFSIRFLNKQSNAAFTKPPRALPLKMRVQIRQVALDTEDSFRDGDTMPVSLNNC